MGEQIGIVHLAEELIKLSGMKPYEDIDIVFTGMKPEEKLNEELLHSTENVMETSHEKIYVARSHWLDIDVLNGLIDELSVLCRAMDSGKAMKVIFAIVPEFSPSWVPQGGSSALFRARRRSKILNSPFKCC